MYVLRLANRPSARDCLCTKRKQQWERRCDMENASFAHHHLGGGQLLMDVLSDMAGTHIFFLLKFFKVKYFFSYAKIYEA